MAENNPLESLIDRFVRLEGFPAGIAGIALQQKIDVLGYVLEKLKFESVHHAEQVTFEEFSQCKVFADTERIVVAAAKNYCQPACGIAPLRLQSPLLIFLLLHHRARFQVLEIIKLIIGKIRGSLTFLDFKKTQTGVTRCFTNTRFAATKLRDFGLLKFTQREAFKTWELSLSGLLVAARLYQDRQTAGTTWSIPAADNVASTGLHGEVRAALDGMGTLEAFIARLRFLCADESRVFETFEPMLADAHRLFLQHRAVLNDAALTQREQKAATAQCIAELETLPFMDAFYDELALSLRIDELLANLK